MSNYYIYIITIEKLNTYNKCKNMDFDFFAGNFCAKGCICLCGCVCLTWLSDSVVLPEGVGFRQARDAGFAARRQACGRRVGPTQSSQRRRRQLRLSLGCRRKTKCLVWPANPSRMERRRHCRAGADWWNERRQP